MTKEGQPFIATFKKFVLPCIEDGKIKIKTAMVFPAIQKEQ